MKFIKHALMLACCCLTLGSYGKQSAKDTSKTNMCANECCCASARQTPLGVMTDHIHGRGQLMVSYTWMDMIMEGNRTGTKETSIDDIHRNYFMAPEKMSMQMHMVMLMYGLTDKLTLMVMGGYVSNNMSMTMAPFMMQMNMPGMGTTGSNMTSKSSGFSDTRIYALYSALNKNDHRIIATFGLNIPTGRINFTGPAMFNIDHRLPYNMQIGSGTYGLLPSVTYVTALGHFSLGAQAGANMNIGKNKQGYRLGNIYNATAWGSYKVLPFMSASLRAEGVVTNKITGFDKRIAELMYNDPSADHNLYGGKRVNAYAGLNFTVKKVVHFLFEAGMPVYENLNGPQMSSSANLLAGVQYSF